MSGFFDPPPSTGTNRAAKNSCARCEGDGLVLVPSDPELDAIAEIYMRCPECNPAPTTEREPVNVDRWWNQ